MFGTHNRLAWPTVSSDLWRDMHLNGAGSSVGNTSWEPAAVFAESGDTFVLRLEVAGVAAESLEIDLEGEHLTVSGERPAPGESEGHKVLMSEIPWGRFRRKFRLGPVADRDAIKATYRDGVLEITVPKVQQARPRRIPVSTAA